MGESEKAAAGRPSCQRWLKKTLLQRTSGCARRSITPKKFASLGFGERATPGEKTQVVQELRLKYPLPLLLEIAQLPRATFYYHLKRMQLSDKYAEAKVEIVSIYHENRGRYGYRRITAALHNSGKHLNHKTVQRLMKELGLVCRIIILAKEEWARLRRIC